MKWVTAKHIRVARAATIWLVKRFVDPDAAFHFVEVGEVLAFAAANDAISLHVAGARYPKRDDRGRGAFEVLVEEHAPDDEALRYLAQVVADADSNRSAEPTPESAGLRAITMAFPSVTSDDHEIVQKSAFLYDAFYATLQARFRARSEPRVSKS